MTKKIDPASAEVRIGAKYPAPFDEPCKARRRTRLGAAAGLTQLGVNRCVLPPGAWSSQRHWHTGDDELVMVLEGEVVLVTNDGEEILGAGDCAGFPKGRADGHHLQNRSPHDAVVLEIGANDPSSVTEYPDIDLRHDLVGYVHRDGTAYPVV